MVTSKVTVVVPIFNVEKYLDRCIQSIVNQTYKNIEILLIDDGSPDRCPEMCDNWVNIDSRIKVIHKENAGLGMARNTGIDNATGEYICFFDSDDYVDHTIIEKSVTCARENASDVVIFGYHNVYDDGKIEKVQMNLSSTIFVNEQICDILLPGMYTYNMGFGISAWGKLYRLASITENDIRFKSERDIISEDAFFALEYYSKINRASVVNESLYFYCKRNESLSRSYKKERQEKNDVFINKAVEYIDKEKLSDNIRNHIIARYHMYTIAAIKQLVNSSIYKKEKRLEMDKILRSETLNRTITPKVLAIHNVKTAVFLTCIKLKLYSLCRLIVCIK